MKRHARISILLFLLLPLYAQSQLTIEDQMFIHVLGLEGKTRAERDEYIKSELAKMGVASFSAPFRKVITSRTDTTIFEGENIVARLGSGSKRLVLGAHFDAFGESPGANDNASGVAVLLGIVERLQGLEWNYSVDVVFFDQEETGRFGSASFIEKFVIPQRYIGMINLDVVGVGEEIYVGPVGGGDDQRLLPVLRRAAKTLNAPFVEKADYPPSDHLSFARANLENISVSVLPRGDGERISRAIQTNTPIDSTISPRVLGIMHTPDDRSILLKPESMRLCYDFVRTVLEYINERP
jgi:hypothetical protein